jgi:predicted Zn-dependent peptidase
MNVEETKKLIAKYFSDIPKGTNAIPRPTVKEDINTGEVRDTIWGKDELPMIVQAYHIPAQGTPEFYAVDMLNTLLSNGESSRLNRAMVEDQQLSLFCGAVTFNLEDPGLTLAFGLANMGVDPKTLEDGMNKEFDKVKEELITEKEFEKLRNQIENTFVSGNSTVAGIAESLANYYTYYGNANLINTEIERYMKVTREDLRNAARKYYIPENRVVLYFLNDPKLSAN